MRTPRLYLDYNATAPVRPEALAVAMAAIDGGGNGSSVHQEGRRAHALVETARHQVATLVGATPDAVVFVSGGTEAANMALRSAPDVRGRALRRLVLGAGEHVAVMAGHGFCADGVETLPVRPDGVIDLDVLRRAVRRNGPAVLALQAANNETGVIQPVREAGEIVRAEGGIVICDAVQAAGRIACDAAALGADIVLLSAHKLGGLQGAGAVVMLNSDVRLNAMLRGGGQERGLRGGTENVPAIAAFGAAAEAVGSVADKPRLAALRDDFEARLRSIAPDAVVFGEGAPRLPNTCAFAIPGMMAERLTMALDLDGVAVSSGSACSSGKVGRSHVLEAMGVEPDLRAGAIRVSFGWRSSSADVEGASSVLADALRRMRRPARIAA